MQFLSPSPQLALRPEPGSLLACRGVADGGLEEIINRGGEKVSPLEVDAVLMDHPAVAQVVTFGMPHAKLGEEAVAKLKKEGVDAQFVELDVTRRDTIAAARAKTERKRS